MRTTEDHRTTPLPPVAATVEGAQEYKTTKPKKWFLIAAFLSAVLLAAAAYFSQAVLRRQPSGAWSLATPKPVRHPEVTLIRLAGSGQGFGPVVEATLPAARSGGETEILDLETGRWLTQPGLECFHEDAGAIATWIRTNALNISCFVWPDGSAACVTYNMTVVPVEKRCWEEIAAGDMPGIPVLAPGQHSPRRLLPLGPGRMETYVFRTDEGTLGMLRLVGLSDHERIVKIRYKLLQARGQTQRDAGATSFMDPALAQPSCLLSNSGRAMEPTGQRVPVRRNVQANARVSSSVLVTLERLIFAPRYVRRDAWRRSSSSYPLRAHRRSRC